MVEKKKYYVWSTFYEAGIAEDYDECTKKFHGQPGGRCKKFVSYEEATKALQDRQNEIAERLASEEEANNISELTQRGNPKPTDNPIQLEAIGGHDTNLETLLNFQDKQSSFNEKIENSFTSIALEVSEISIDLKDQDCRVKNLVKELKIELNNRIESLKDELRQEFGKQLADMKSANTRLKNKVKKLESEIE